ncbi:MAG TPA: flagellar hook-associated protein FlgK [Bryobacteraceae bacterium]|nr:flagellar hook-associated protein FlgK [Bryobacteraceae bacterium]
MSNLLAMIGSSGHALDVFQQALNVIQSNVSNSSTPGYAAQSLNLEAAPLDAAGGLAGGVAAAGLDNSRDQYAEEQVQQQTQMLGRYTAQAQATSAIQSLFDVSGTGGVSAALSSLFTAFSSWSANTSDASAQQSVMDAASNVATAVQDLRSSLSASSQEVGSQIASTVTQINNIGTQIQAYNVQRLTESSPDPGEEAQLYSALDNLSQLTNFTTVTQANGQVTVMLGNGSPLVIGGQQNDLSSASTSSGTEILDAQGQDVTAQITGGQLGGMLDVQNSVIGSILGGSSQPGSLNEFASSLADTVNQILESGTVSTAAGASAGSALFTYDPTDAAGTLAVNSSTSAAQLAPVDSTGNANGNANQLASLESAPLALLGGKTLTQYFGQIASGVGAANQTATDNQTSQTQVVASATSLVNQVSGVSLDAEATNVLQFERAYQASAQVLTVMNTLVDSVLSMVQPWS